MRTLSDHIFDLVQNSINAEAQNIHVIVEENTSENSFKIIIKDDGHGIKPEHLSKIKNTFFTTRSHTKRRVGLGLALMDATCQRTGGSLAVESEYRRGTTVTATMEHDHADRPPIGDLPDVFASLMSSTAENKIIWTLEHHFDGEKYRLKNRTTADELNIFSYAESGVRDMLYKLINKKEEKIHR